MAVHEGMTDTNNTPTDAPARAWRPDLVPHILAWLDGIPEDSRRYLVHTSSTAAGGLLATFEFKDVFVCIRFDSIDGMLMVAEGYDGHWSTEGLQPFEQGLLERARRRAVPGHWRAEARVGGHA